MRGYYGIGLQHPKYSVNVGATIRAAGVYDASFVATTGERFGKTRTDTMKHYRHMPFYRVDDLKDIIPYNCVPVAIDIIEGARSLIDYVHPERAFYIFGAEDRTLDINWRRDTVYIPTKYCMNLAATVNVVLYDRLAKDSN